MKEESERMTKEVHKMTEEEKSYQAYLKRVSALSFPIKATPEQINELRKQGYKVN